MALSLEHIQRIHKKHKEASSMGSASSSLHQAVINENLSDVRTFLKQNPFARSISFYEEDGFGIYPILYSLVCSNSKILETFVEADPSVIEFQFVTGQYLVHFAAQSSDPSMLKYLASKGARLDVTNHEGYTPLHLATEANAISCVEFLLTQKVDINAVAKRGDTPKGLAEYFGHAEIQKLFIDYTYQKTREFWSAMSNTDDKEKLKALMDTNVDFTIEDCADMDCSEDEVSAFAPAPTKGNTILHHAGRLGNAAAIELLADQKPSFLFTTNQKNDLPFHEVASPTQQQYLLYKMLESLNSHLVDGVKVKIKDKEPKEDELLRVTLSFSKEKEKGTKRKFGGQTYDETSSKRHKS